MFGSVIHGDDTETSGLDLLIDPTQETTLLDIGAIRYELHKLLGVPVDLLTPKALPESFRATAAADIFCLPSYREGFGTVVIEAVAVGVPAIASRIYGITDAVVEGETGLLHEPHDVNNIKNCMEKVMNNQVLRLKLGGQARDRAIKDFSSHLVTQAWVNFFFENMR